MTLRHLYAGLMTSKIASDRSTRLVFETLLFCQDLN